MKPNNARRTTVCFQPDVVYNGNDNDNGNDNGNGNMVLYRATSVILSVQSALYIANDSVARSRKTPQIN